METIYQLRYGNYIEIENDIWFFNQNFNGLVRVCKDNGRIKKIYRDIMCYVQGRFLYEGIAYYNRKIVLLPLAKSTITFFDMNNESFEYIEIDCSRFTTGKVCSIGHYQESQYIYMFPANMSALIKIDLDSKQVQYIDAGIKKKIQQSSGFVFRNQFEILDHKIYIPFTSCTGIAIYDMSTDTFEVKLENRVENCSTVSYKDGKLFLGSWEKKMMYIWNMETDVVETEIFRVETKTNNVFNASCVKGNVLVLIPYHSDEIISYDTQTFNKDYFHVDVDMDDSLTCYQIKKENNTLCLSGSNNISELVLTNDGIKVMPWLIMDDQYNKHVIAEYLVDNEIYNMVNEKDGSLNEMLSVFTYL